MTVVSLTRHPSTPADAVRGLSVRVHRSAEGVLALAYCLDADIARICVPGPRSPAVAHQLWEHTCFEAFIAIAEATAYHEFNFAPSGEWAAYEFHSYRNVAGLGDEALDPRIAVRQGADRLELDARVALDRLSAVHRRAALRLGLSAVIEDHHGARSYWSLRHPAGPPDFHHAEALALRLEPTGEEC
jgi:hypothetical protein